MITTQRSKQSPSDIRNMTETEDTAAAERGGKVLQSDVKLGSAPPPLVPESSQAAGKCTRSLSRARRGSRCLCAAPNSARDAPPSSTPAHRALEAASASSQAGLLSGHVAPAPAARYRSAWSRAAQSVPPLRLGLDLDLAEAPAVFLSLSLSAFLSNFLTL